MATISKIKTPDGAVHDLQDVKYVYIVDNAENSNVTFNITNFTGTVTVISRNVDDYRLNIQSPGT